MVKVGQAIYQARLEKGWSQTQLAVRAGVSTVSVSHWETDFNIPSIRSLRKLERALRVNLTPRAEAPIQQLVEMPGEEMPTLPQLIETAERLVGATQRLLTDLRRLTS